MKIFSTLCFFLLSLWLSAQISYGQIEYLQTSEIVYIPEGEEDEENAAHNKQIRDMIAKMSASGAFNKNFTATFSPTEFNFVEQVKDPAEMRSEGAGGTVMVVMTGDEDPRHFYTDTKGNEVINKDFILDKAFLVSGKNEPLEWVETGEKIAPSEATAGLDLKVAWAVTPLGDTITAGYAPSMPVQVGPLNYFGLPGAIITLEIPKGKSKTVFRATKIILSQEEMPIRKPAEGKSISLKKFREEKIKREKKTRTTRREIHD